MDITYGTNSDRLGFRADRRARYFCRQLFLFLDTFSELVTLIAKEVRVSYKHENIMKTWEVATADLEQ